MPKPHSGRPVRAKKRLGQHFLNDLQAAERIVESLVPPAEGPVIEIGPGMGVLTNILVERFPNRLTCLELDEQAIGYLKNQLPQLGERLIHADCLQYDFSNIKADKLAFIGNLPYNISSQILFRMLELKERVDSAVFMLQREVAERIASPPGSRKYGILSVLLQAYYKIDLLLTLPPGAFSPPPKVHSSVVRLSRNQRKSLPCNESLFKRVVKIAFNQRRKTLRNSLKGEFELNQEEIPFLTLRPEALSVEDFIRLTNALEQQAD